MPTSVEVLLATPEDGLYPEPRPYNDYLQSFISDRRFRWFGLLDGGSVQQPLTTVELPLAEIEEIRWRRPRGKTALIIGTSILLNSLFTFFFLDLGAAITVVWIAAVFFFFTFFYRFSATRIPVYVVTAGGKDYVLFFGGNQRAIANYMDILRRAVEVSKAGLTGISLHSRLKHDGAT